MDISIKKLLVNMSTYGDKPTGLGIYAIKCCKVIAEKYPCSVFLSSHNLDNVNLISTPKSITIGYDKFAAVRRFFWGTNKINHAYIDLAYSPTHHSIRTTVPQIITIHDLICFDFPRQHIFQYLYFKFVIPFVIKRCIAVFTVSEYTKKRICDSYGVPSERVFVVPNSIDADAYSILDEEPISLSSFPMDKPFILTVGARYKHKNLEELLLNYASWCGKYNLIVTSCGGKYRTCIEELIKQLGIGGSVYIYEYVDFFNLRRLYKNAVCLVYPSLVEGFGIPPLESIASSRPVIVSDIPVFREVLGDAAIYVNNGVPESWKTAFELLDNNEAMERLRLMWPEVLDRFSYLNFENRLVEALSASCQIKRNS